MIQKACDSERERGGETGLSCPTRLRGGGGGNKQVKSEGNWKLHYLSDEATPSFWTFTWLFPVSHMCSCKLDTVAVTEGSFLLILSEYMSC